MNLPGVGKWSWPSFLKRKVQEDQIANELDQLCYEFTLKLTDSSDIYEIRRLILLNPWSLIFKPTITLKEDDSDCLATVSFYVLSKEKGREIESDIIDRELK